MACSCRSWWTGLMGIKMSRTDLVAALVLYVAAACTAAAETEKVQDPIVAGDGIAEIQTDYGPVRGYVSKGIYTYKGIPYASANRFEEPKPPAVWTESRFMGYYGATCPFDIASIASRGNGTGMFALQNDWGYPSEECLNLNVWTPGLNDGQKRPIMVWIHGGAWEWGSSHELPYYDGENLSRRGDVVVVSVNHRLNILGFLDLSEYGEKFERSGNNSLIDLVASLSWIRSHAERFGGDPDNVTVFGQSGGGAKITALLNSPVGSKDFHRAVVQSGSYMSSYLDQSVARRVTDAVVEELGIPADDIDAIQTVPYEQLLAAGKSGLQKVQQELTGDSEPVDSNMRLGWGPINDDYFLPYEKIFGSEAIELSMDKEIMIGTTKSEFAVGVAARARNSMEATDAILQELYGAGAESYKRAVLSAYPETHNPSDYLAIDGMFRPGALRDANSLSEGGHDNLYVYLFEWESPVDDGALKSMHCMELPFVFFNIEHGKEMTGGGQGAHAFAEVVSGAWINFARKGDPNADGLPAWPRFTHNQGETMIMNSDSRVGHRHDKELLSIMTRGSGND